MQNHFHDSPLTFKESKQIIIVTVDKNQTFDLSTNLSFFK